MTDDERRQRLIVAQSSIKAAIDYNANHEDSLDKVLHCANEIFDWVINKGDNNEVNSKPSISCSGSNMSNNYTGSVPVPTLKQKEWLDKIETKHGFTPKQVKEVYGKYPLTKEEALECIRMLKKQN